MAGIYNGHLLEFPQIRVDCFTSPRLTESSPWLIPPPISYPNLAPRPVPSAQLFLLTHVHSDHLLGLSDNFTGHIVCSPDTKQMLLRLEAERERELVADGWKETGRKKYEGLRSKLVGKGTKEERVVDLIETVPYGVPKEYRLGYEGGKPLKVTITLFDANHCPGSTMFSITSPDHAVLHTGDVRADSLFRQCLWRNPFVGEFLVPVNSSNSVKGKCKSKAGRRVLDRIYLDTSAALRTGDMPDKETVLRDLVEQMSLYPDETVFFLNVWCFGWEDVVKEVARHFDTFVHVDRYKREMYTAIQSDPFLSACTTTDHTLTRFHACERKFKCEDCRLFDRQGQRVWNKDKLVVNVQMVEVRSATWEIERQCFLEKLGAAATREGLWPYTIECPMARHSPLPELQALVKMFQPRSISPNTVVPQANGLDYYLLPEMFRCSLSREAHDTLLRERDEWFGLSRRFGQKYLDDMNQMTAIGIPLIPGMSMGLDPGDTSLETMSDVGGIEHCDRVIGRDRQHQALEQMARAGGPPRSDPKQMKEMMSTISRIGQWSFSEVPGSLGSYAEKARMDMIRSNGICGGMSGEMMLWETMGVKSEAEEYDTQEETRGNRLGSTSSSCLAVSSVNPLPSSDNHRADSSTDSKKSVEVDKKASAPMSSSQFKRNGSRAVGAKPRFAVDKEHLRALANVSADIDDL